MLEETMRSLRMEILQVLADNAGSTCSRAARAVVYGWTDEQMQTEFGMTPKRVQRWRYKTRLFKDGVVPTTSYAEGVSEFYRDALNFTDLLSDHAVIYAEMMVLRLHAARPDRVKQGPLNRMDHMRLCS